jgi:hypothetical protein
MLKISLHNLSRYILSEGIDVSGLVKCHTYSILSEGIDVSGLVKCHIYSVLAERNVCGTINFFDLIQIIDINSFTQDRVSVTFYQIIDINSFTQDRVSVTFYQTTDINSFTQTLTLS